METILSIVQVFLSIVLIFLVLMHSGKDAGLSGAFGVGTGQARWAAARSSSATSTADDRFRDRVRDQHRFAVEEALGLGVRGFPASARGRWGRFFDAWPFFPRIRLEKRPRRGCRSLPFPSR